MDIRLNTSGKALDLPCQAELLIPQKPPMMIVDRLVERDRVENFSVVEADGPLTGLFNPDGNKIIPEYFIELLAQAMAAVNGFDSLVDGKENQTGLLVGVNNFKWFGPAIRSGRFRIEIFKDFEFGQVTVMSGKVYNESGDIVASGEIKAWEEKP